MCDQETVQDQREELVAQDTFK